MATSSPTEQIVHKTAQLPNAGTRCPKPVSSPRHPMHVLDQRCVCCRRPWPDIEALTGEARGSYRNPEAPCRQCLPHLGFSMRSDTEHLQMWITLDQHHQDRAASQVALLQGDLEGMRAQLDARPERLVEKYLDADVLVEARRTAERAFSSRERAWRTLVQVRLLHHEVENGRCRCGRRADQCDVAQLLADYRALNGWEQQQVARCRCGLAHGLPSGHPATLDRRIVDLEDASIDLDEMLDELPEW